MGVLRGDGRVRDRRALRSAVVLLGGACAGFIALGPRVAAAEWFTDAYFGGAFTRADDVRLRSDAISIGGVGLPVSVRAELENVETDDFLTFGVRFGHWLEAAPMVGLAVDALLFGPEVGAQTVRARATGDLRGEVFDAPIAIPEGRASAVPIPGIDVPVTGVFSLGVMLRLPLWTTPDFLDGRLQPYVAAGPALLLTDDRPKFDLGY